MTGRRANSWMWEDFLERIAYGDTPFRGDVCWHWTERLDQDGYGWLPGRLGAREAAGTPLAHRYAYTIQRGRVPRDKVLDHLCRNRSCANPWHLQIVSNLENITAPGSQHPAAHPESATHCNQGHEWTDENIYRNSHGYRLCRTCQREHGRLYQQKKRSRERAARSTTKR